MSKQKSIPKQEDLQSIINALSVAIHLLHPMWRLTTSNQLLVKKDLQHGVALLKDCSVRLKTYKQSVKRATKQKRKLKGTNEGTTS